MKIITYCLQKGMVSYCLAFTLALLTLPFPLQAQEKESLPVEITTDIVTQNIWRGVCQAGASIQPSVTAGYKNFEFFVWGTTDFQSTQHEIDFTINHTIRDFTFGITDYWSGDMGDNYSLNHQLEAKIMYTFPKIPLSLEWNTVFLGEKQPRVYSSYAEIRYALELPQINFDFSIGFTPWENQILETDQFALTSLLITAGRQIPISSQFTIIPACTLVYNPAADQLYFFVKMGFIFPKF